MMKRQEVKWTGEWIGKHCIYNDRKKTLIVLKSLFQNEEKEVDDNSVNLSPEEKVYDAIMESFLSSRNDEVDLLSTSSFLKRSNIICDNGDIVVYGMPNREVALEAVQEMEKYLSQEDENENDFIELFWRFWENLFDSVFSFFLKSNKE